MKAFMGLLAMLFSVPLSGWALQEIEAEQMKSDLVGEVMGGREVGWKFQSASQIKELTIEEREEEVQQRVYTIKLRLEDSKVTGVYEAEAKVTYKQVDDGWQIDTVGLLSMKRIE